MLTRMMKKIRSRHQRYLEDYSKEDFASIWNFLCSRCTQLSPQSEPSWLLRLESQQCVIEHGTFCYKTSRTSSPCSMTQSPPQLHVLPGSSWLLKLCMILLLVSTEKLGCVFCLLLGSGAGQSVPITTKESSYFYENVHPNQLMTPVVLEGGFHEALCLELRKGLLLVHVWYSQLSGNSVNIVRL